MRNYPINRLTTLWIAVWLLSATATAQGQSLIHVSTAEDLVSNVASERTIVLEPGAVDSSVITLENLAVGHTETGD